MLSPNWQRVCAWSAVAISTLIGGFWGFWGSIEDFRWYFTSLSRDLVPRVGRLLGLSVRPGAFPLT